VLAPNIGEDLLVGSSPVALLTAAPVVDADTFAHEQAVLDAAWDDEAQNLRWPDDSQEVPAWWHVVNARAERYGLPRLRYSTRAEFEAQEDLCALTVPVEPEIVSPTRDEVEEDVDDENPPLPELPPAEAARLFVAELRWEMADSGDECARYSHRQIWSRYMEYCETENRVPCAQNMLLGAFVRLPGVTKRKEDLPKDQRGHKRARPVIYTIQRVPPAAAVVNIRQAA